MTFRNKLTAAAAVDTRTTPTGAGVQVLTDNSNPATPRGMVQFTDGFAGDSPAQIVQHAEANTRAVNASQSGGITVVGGSYNSPAGQVSAPNMDMSVVLHGDGSRSRLAQFTGADAVTAGGLVLPAVGATSKQIVGAPLPANMQPVVKIMTDTFSGNASGDVTIAFPGGAFANGLIGLSVTVVPAAAGPYLWIPWNPTLTGINMRCYQAGSSTAVPNPVLAATITAIGW